MGIKTKELSAPQNDLYNPCFDSSWEHYALYDLADWVNGMAFRDINFSPNGRPVIKIAEIKNGIAGQTKFTNEEYDQIYCVTAGDMLFSWSGQPETSIDVFYWNRPDGWLNQHIFKVLPKSVCTKKYFYYLLKYLNQNFVMIARNKQTTGLGHVTRKDLQKIKVGVPLKRDQRAIAHILGALDDKIEHNRKMNETLEAMARAVFKNWFVDFEPIPGHGPHKEWQDSPLGKIPKGWEVVSFASTVEIYSGGTPKTSVPEYWGGDIPWYAVGDAPRGSDVYVIDTAKKITKAGVENSATRILPAGTTIISARGTVGKLALTGVSMAMNQTCYGLQGRTENSSAYTFFSTLNLITTLQQRTHGSVFDTITRDTLASVEVVLPPSKIIEKFEVTVAPVMEHILNNLWQSRTLAAIRDALLPKLLSGEMRVKDAEKCMGAVS